MSITRREFTLGTGSLVALTILGCNSKSAFAQRAGGDDSKPEKPPLPKEPFDVGKVEQYRPPGVYDQYNQTHRLWLVSDGKVLVATVDMCTHLGCGLQWFSKENLFDCPCHKSEFDAQGTPMKGSKARRPLERYAISLVETDQGKVVHIDPAVRLRKDRNQWDDPRASLTM